MNHLQIIFKQMRQRALSTWLTLLSVALGVGLAIAVLLAQRHAHALFGQNDFGFDILIGPKGSPLQLSLNTIYHLDKPPGTISYSVYEKLIRGGPWFGLSRTAIPLAVGDNYEGFTIIGTVPKLFGGDDDGKVNPDGGGAQEYRVGKRYTLASGTCFHLRRFEAVVGSDIAARKQAGHGGLKIGDTFHATHGMGNQEGPPDIHPEIWTVVGVLAPTHTAADRSIYIPLVSFYAIQEHEAGLEHIAAVQAAESRTTLPAPSPPPPASTQEEEPYTLAPDGTITLRVPKEEWQISAILVKSRSGLTALALVDQVNKGTQASAVNPASVMGDFFRTFLTPFTRLFLLISLLVTLLATIGILVSIYNAVSARRREIAILRALGATRTRILLLVSLEAGWIGLLGGLTGLVLGHLLAAAGSAYLERIMGQGIPWRAFSAEELLYVAAATVLAFLAGLAPALLAYRTPVAENLTE